MRVANSFCYAMRPLPQKGATIAKEENSNPPPMVERRSEDLDLQNSLEYLRAIGFDLTAGPWWATGLQCSAVCHLSLRNPSRLYRLGFLLSSAA
jgi:hypothetical protein